jgi:hypothetical protein
VITQAIISFFGSLVGGILGLLPLPAAPSFAGFLTAWGTVWSYVGWLNGYLPISEALAMVLLLLGLWVVFHAYRAFMWAYHQVWGSD